MRKLCFVFLLCFQTWDILAGDVKYPVSSIPDDMRQNVNVVVREDKTVFRILGRNKATLYTHFVVTILNEKGKDYARQTLGYNKLTKITNLSAVVYNAEGEQIKKVKTSEIYDQSDFDGFSLYSDERFKSVNIAQATYPYTADFEYEIEYKYLYSIPGSFLGGEERSVQHVSYQLIFPPELAPRYKVLNIENKPSKEKLSNGFESISWSFENLKPYKFEPNGPRRAELLPQIMAAPSLFEYDGYPGNMTTWKDYGKWNAMLNQGRDSLPKATKTKILELTKGLPSTELKARALYEYLQSRTRYVSIQLGIGGLQPFPAAVVDETGYGDCKALSNYMVAMLKEVGIKGYYVTIHAGDDRREVIVDFPSHQSNHVIVAVPNGKDTLWMECTSQTKPFGYMGRFTGDRLALMITDEGGKLVRTPAYSADQNLQSRTVQLLVDQSGNARASVQTTYAGIQYENGGLSELLGNQFDEQRKWIQNSIDIPNFVVNNFSMLGKKERIPSAIVKFDLTLNRYASVSGKRLFITPNLMNKNSFVPEKAVDRKTDVVRYSNYLDLDTVLLKFPENLYPEFLPQPVKISSRFGEYEATYQFKEGELVYIRKMKVWKTRLPKDSYDEFVDFYKRVAKSDNMKLVFLNKT